METSFIDGSKSEEYDEVEMKRGQREQSVRASLVNVAFGALSSALESRRNISNNHLQDVFLHAKRTLRPRRSIIKRLAPAGSFKRVPPYGRIGPPTGRMKREARSEPARILWPAASHSHALLYVTICEPVRATMSPHHFVLYPA